MLLRKPREIVKVFNRSSNKLLKKQWKKDRCSAIAGRALWVEPKRIDLGVGQIRCCKEKQLLKLPMLKIK